MRIWLIGGGQASLVALRQLHKNDAIEVVVSAGSDRPVVVQEGVIAQVDFVETVTPVNVNQLGRRTRPDLILLDSTAAGSFGRGASQSALSHALAEETAAASDYPCLVI
jgi:hypothetical protein